MPHIDLNQPLPSLNEGKRARSPSLEEIQETSPSAKAATHASSSPLSSSTLSKSKEVKLSTRQLISKVTSATSANRGSGAIASTSSGVLSKEEGARYSSLDEQIHALMHANSAATTIAAAATTTTTAITTTAGGDGQNEKVNDGTNVVVRTTPAAPAVGSVHSGDRRVYFAHKHIKLAEQNERYYGKGRESDRDSDIFAGVVCFFNSETAIPGAFAV